MSTNSAKYVQTVCQNSKCKHYHKGSTKFAGYCILNVGLSDRLPLDKSGACPVMNAVECDFCKRLPEELPIKSNADTGRVLAIIAQGDNKKELIFSDHTIAYGIEINYCPICGRELNA